MLLPVTLLLGLQSAQLASLDRSVVVELARDPRSEAVVAEHAPRIDFAGDLLVWLRADELSGLALEVVNAAGEVETRVVGAPPAPTPYVRVEVEPGAPCLVRVRGPAEAASRRVELRLFASVVDEAVRAALVRGDERLEAVGALFAAGERGEAERVLAEGLDDAVLALGASGALEVLQQVWRLGVTASRRGASRTALRAFQEVHDHLTERVPPDDPALQQARDTVATILLDLGDLDRALALRREILAIQERVSPPGAREIQRARNGLAAAYLHAHAPLEARSASEAVIAELEPLTTPDDPELLVAREQLALALRELHDLAGAEREGQAVLAGYARTRPADDHDLLRARFNLASTRLLRGDAAGAVAEFEHALRVIAGLYPDDHPDGLAIRQNLAVARRALGDLTGVRALEEAVLAARERNLPPDHPEVQTARGNLARTLKLLGDVPAARVLEEAVLAVEERRYADDHPDLMRARVNLSTTLTRLGDQAGARRLRAVVRAAVEARLDAEHPLRLEARAGLGNEAYEDGDFEGAYRIYAEVLEVLERVLSPRDEQVVALRRNLALAASRVGRHAEAEELAASLLAFRESALPAGHPEVRRARSDFAWAIAARVEALEGRGDDEARAQAMRRARDLVRDLARHAREAARAAVLSGSAREAEERCAALQPDLETVVAFARGNAGFGPDVELLREAFALSEATRSAGLAAAALARRAAGSAEFTRLRGELREAGAVLAALAQSGATGAELHTARARRESAERALAALTEERGLAELEVEASALAARLPADAAAVAYRRVRTSERTSSQAIDGLTAFVLRPSAIGTGDLRHVELGPLGPIEQAVRAWRGAIGAVAERGLAAAQDAEAERAAGSALRRMVWDPLLPALGDARHVIVVLDDVLHLVALDALQLDEPAGGAQPALLGARWRLETRVSLRELLASRPALPAGGTLVALGGAAFNSQPARLAEVDPPLLATAEPAALSSPGARPRAWERGFAPLTFAGLEARELAALHDEVFGEQPGALLLEKRQASRGALLEAAGAARFLHVATHGWFAPEAVLAWDAAAGREDEAASVVRGMSPMLLTGLALAGANLPPDATGRVPGILTAEELSTLDLAACELAVLSACDTNTGVRRAGQGLASLQKALEMAGARSVITSLWKVPDEATRDLMLDLYRRMWVEQKPKQVALWEAKMRLADQRDESGARIHATRDWAAWVLTGEPR